MSSESQPPPPASLPTESGILSPEPLLPHEGPTVTPEVLMTMEALSDPSAWGDGIWLPDDATGNDYAICTHHGFSQAEIVAVGQGLFPDQAHVFQDAWVTHYLSSPKGTGFIEWAKNDQGIDLDNPTQRVYLPRLIDKYQWIIREPITPDTVQAFMGEWEKGGQVKAPLNMLPDERSPEGANEFINGLRNNLRKILIEKRQKIDDIKRKELVEMKLASLPELSQIESTDSIDSLIELLLKMSIDVENVDYETLESVHWGWEAATCHIDETKDPPVTIRVNFPSGRKPIIDFLSESPLQTLLGDYRVQLELNCTENDSQNIRLTGCLDYPEMDIVTRNGLEIWPANRNPTPANFRDVKAGNIEFLMTEKKPGTMRKVFATGGEVHRCSIQELCLHFSPEERSSAIAIHDSQLDKVNVLKPNATVECKNSRIHAVDVYADALALSLDYGTSIYQVVSQSEKAKAIRFNSDPGNSIVCDFAQVVCPDRADQVVYIRNRDEKNTDCNVRRITLPHLNDDNASDSFEELPPNTSTFWDRRMAKKAQVALPGKPPRNFIIVESTLCAPGKSIDYDRTTVLEERDFGEKKEFTPIRSFAPDYPNGTGDQYIIKADPQGELAVYQVPTYFTKRDCDTYFRMKSECELRNPSGVSTQFRRLEVGNNAHEFKVLGFIKDFSGLKTGETAYSQHLFAEGSATAFCVRNDQDPDKLFALVVYLKSPFRGEQREDMTGTDLVRLMSASGISASWVSQLRQGTNLYPTVYDRGCISNFTNPEFVSGVMTNIQNNKVNGAGWVLMDWVSGTHQFYEIENKALLKEGQEAKDRERLELLQLGYLVRKQELVVSQETGTYGLVDNSVCFPLSRQALGEYLGHLEQLVQVGDHPLSVPKTVQDAYFQYIFKDDTEQEFAKELNDEQLEMYRSWKREYLSSLA